MKDEEEFLIKITSKGAHIGVQMLAQTFFMPVWYFRENPEATLRDYIEDSYKQFKKIAGIAKRNDEGDITLRDLQDVAETEELVEHQYNLWKKENV